MLIRATVENAVVKKGSNKTEKEKGRYDYHKKVMSYIDVGVR